MALDLEVLDWLFSPGTLLSALLDGRVALLHGFLETRLRLGKLNTPHLEGSGLQPNFWHPH